MTLYLPPALEAGISDCRVIARSRPGTEFESALLERFCVHALPEVECNT
jgi:hypothetical protein